MNALSGLVTRLHGQHAYVQAGGVEYRCPLRGRLKKGPRRDRSPVAVGDRVTITPIAGDGEPEAALEQVHPRMGELYRSHPRDRRLRQLIAVNVDTLVIVAGADRLAEQLTTVDRLLASAHLQSLTPVLVINKCDLGDRATLDETLRPYAAMNLEIHFTCATRGELDGLGSRFAGHTAVFAGQSGTGKTSLVNALQPGLNLRTGDVDRDGEGRHTTTAATLLPLAGGHVVDTPGVRDFGFYDLNLADLSLVYPDFAQARRQCRFATCTHRHEPHCGVKAAVERGELDRGRYERYLGILREEWNAEQNRAP